MNIRYHGLFLKSVFIFKKEKWKKMLTLFTIHFMEANTPDVHCVIEALQNLMYIRLLPFLCSNKKSLWHCILDWTATLWDCRVQTKATKEIFLPPRLTIFIYQFLVKGLSEFIYTHQVNEKAFLDVECILYIFQKVNV